MKMNEVGLTRRFRHACSISVRGRFVIDSLSRPRPTDCHPPHRRNTTLAEGSTSWHGRLLRASSPRAARHFLPYAFLGRLRGFAMRMPSLRVSPPLSPHGITVNLDGRRAEASDRERPTFRRSLVEGQWVSG